MVKKIVPLPVDDAPKKLVRYKASQKRNPRKIIEATEKDFIRWKKGADREGVNFTEFCRRALEARFREFKR